VWDWHFGRPLVTTPSNFGQLGDRPSHPELLDDLAARFIANGWSLKWLHREIVLSAAYRQAAVHNAAYDHADPDNRLIWRMNRQRLDAESWRDAVLSVTNQLDTAIGGPSVDLDKDHNRRRTVYATVSRQRPADLLRLFDFPDAKRHSDQRILTTTPLQQLYLLNSPFLQRQAVLLAEQVVADSRTDDREANEMPEPQQIIRELFRRVLLRNPTGGELANALQLVIAEQIDGAEGALETWAILAHGLLASNEFMFVD
jgi:hypothetical protein